MNRFSIQPVQQLEGTTVLDYLECVEALEPEQQKSFLDDIALIADRDLNGEAGRIDPGEETLLLAKLFHQFYPKVRSITAADVSAYQTLLWERRRVAVEGDARGIVRAMQANSKLKEVVFQGEPYRIGIHNLNEAVNRALEAAGSNYRIFVGVYVGAGPDTGPVVFFGPMNFEQKLEIGAREFRVIAMEKLEARISSKPVPAINDYVSTIMILGGEHRQVLRQYEQDRRWLQYFPYRRDVLQKAFAEYQAMGGARRGDLDRWARPLQTAHERRHIEALDEFGIELRRLLNTFRQHGEGALYALEEFYADLAAVETMVEMASSHPEEAKGIYCYRLMSRGGQSSAFAVSSTLLLLSAAELEGDDLVIHWDQLKDRTELFKREVAEMFRDIIHRFRAAAVGLYPDQPAEQIIKNYQERLAWHYEHQKDKEPDLPGLALRYKALSELEEIVLARPGFDHGRMLDELQERILGYRIRFNQMMVRVLGLDPHMVPFRVSARNSR